MSCSFKPCTKQENKYTFWTILNGFIRDNKMLFALFIGILLAMPFKDIMLPHLVGKLYSAIKGSNHSSVRTCIFFIISIVIFVQIVYIISDYIRTIMLPMIQKYSREMMLKHIMDTRATNFDEVRIGVLISIMMKLPMVIYTFIDKWRYSYIPSFITMFGALIYFFWVDFVLGITLAIVVVVFCLVVWQTFTSCITDSIVRDQLFNETNDKVDDVLRNLMTVMSGNTIKKEMEDMDIIHQHYLVATKNTLTCSLAGKYTMIITVLVYFAFLCWYCYSYKKLDTAKVISVLIIMFVVINTVLNMTSSLNDMLSKWGVIQNSLGVFDTCERDITLYKNPPRKSTGIVFQDVWYSYESGRAVFENLNLDIELGHVTIIEGVNGSGKSTLIQLLLKYHIPQCGEIFINGIPYSQINQNDLRQHVAFIPQNPILLNRTVFDNIIYGLPGEPTKEHVVEVCKRFAPGFFESLPTGIDTEVGSYGSHLSGGQRQIVWILKVLMMDPDVVVMDEPTASIDEANKQIVHFVLNKMMEEKTKSGERRTVIMITHDPVFKEQRDKHKFVTIEKHA